MILPVPFSLYTIILFDLFKFSRRKEVPFFKIQKRKNGTAVLDGIVSNSADCEQNLKDTRVRERDFKKFVIENIRGDRSYSRVMILEL